MQPFQRNGVFVNVDINAYGARNPNIILLRGTTNNDGVPDALQGVNSVLSCYLYPATKRFEFVTLDPSMSIYAFDGADYVKMVPNGQGGRMEHKVIGTPLTLVPCYPALQVNSSEQINALSARLAGYYSTMAKFEDSIYDEQYHWRHSWVELFRQIRCTLSQAPALYEQNIGGRRVPARHAAFAPIPNHGISEMERFGVSENVMGADGNTRVKFKHFRMCMTGQYDEIRFRKYDYNYHVGLFGNAGYDFPTYEGEAATWQRADGRVRITGKWDATPCNACITCILQVDNDGQVLTGEIDFGVIILQYDINLRLKQNSQKLYLP